MKIQNKLLQLISRTKVQKQLFFIYFTALLIPILLICLFLLTNTKHLLYKHYESLVESDNLRVKSIMFDVTTNFYNLSEDISSDRQLHTLLETEYASNVESRKAFSRYSRINTLLKNDTSVSSIYIYTLNDTVSDYDNFKYAAEEIRNTDWFGTAGKKPGIFWKTYIRTDKYKNEYWEITLYRKIPLVATKSYAVLAMTISDNYLKNRIENNALLNIIALNDGPVFYGTNRQLIGKNLGIFIDYTENYYKYIGKLTLGEKDCMGAVSTLRPYKSDDSLYIVTLDLEAIPYVKQVSITYIIIFLVIILIPLLLIYVFTRFFSSRVEMLRYAMHKASGGDYNIIDSFQGDDEISETFSDLKVMIGKIKETEADIYESQLTEQRFINRQQEMEFKMLAGQINPHFLYNTLEIIRMMAFTSGNRDVATAIKLLGKSMRYVLENTGTSSTTLEKELDYIEMYLAIQKLHFNERLHYTLQVQEGLDLNKYKILPLLLQPIVENAILHGLNEAPENGLLSITINKEEEEFLLITVSDNGTGMTEEELKSVNANIYEHRDSSMGIGFYNINQRIKLCYGTAYGIEIKSRKGKGTVVLLKLPLYNILEE